MQYVTIKKETTVSGDKTIFLVPALTLKNSQGQKKQQIPHPLGTDYLTFDTIEDAVRAVEISGFQCIFPDGVKSEYKGVEHNFVDKSIEDNILLTLKQQLNDINSSVVAAALNALGELEDKNLLALFVEKIGEDNELIRTAAISSIVKIGTSAIESLMKALKDENWVRRNSALICISRLIDNEGVNPETLFSVLIKMTEDKNTIVKTSAISVLGKAYKVYKKNS